MPVRLDDVAVFKLCRRRQQDVRIIGGVGLELFMDDSEQVFALESFDDLRLIRRDRRRIRVVNIKRPHRRLGCGQRFAEPRHIDRARIAAHQVRPVQHAFIQRKRAAGR